MIKWIALALVAIPILAYVNCSGKVQLNETQFFPLAKAAGGICVPKDYELESFFIKNINISMQDGKWEIDSDGDGLTDAVELEYGTNPLNRRTFGFVLDSICFDQGSLKTCENLAISCQAQPTNMGLNDCDILMLDLDRLTQVNPMGGLDSDRDGIPDLFEILNGGFPAVSDAYADPDRDTVTNLQEYRQGSHPFQGDFDTQPKLEYSLTKTKSLADCEEGQYWQVDVKSIPVYEMPGFFDDSVAVPDGQGFALNHATNENVIVVVYKIRPQNKQVDDNSKMFYAVKKLAYKSANDAGTIEIQAKDFFEAGEVEP